MNRAECHKLAEEKIKDASALLDGARWSSAYYVSGYAVECALKSCFLNRIVLTGWPFKDDVKKIDECRVHDFVKLVQIAGLRGELDARLQASSRDSDDFIRNWEEVCKWKVESRYQPISEAQARKLFAAITDKPWGVLEWIMNYW